MKRPLCEYDRKTSPRRNLYDLERLRADTRRSYWMMRLGRVFIVLACAAAIDLLTRWHAPQAREEALRGVLEFLKGLL